MGLRRVQLLAAAIAASCVRRPRGRRDRSRRPPTGRLAARARATSRSRTAPCASLDKIVVHVTEGAVALGPPAEEPARACLLPLRDREKRPYRPARAPVRHRLACGQLGHQRRSRSASSTRASRTGRSGFTDAQYRSSARLTAWIARRSLMPIDRRHVIGHADVPGAPGGGRGGASHHTDPGPRWELEPYLRPRAHLRDPRLPAVERRADRAGGDRCAASSPGAHRRPAGSAASSSSIDGRIASGSTGRRRSPSRAGEG